MLTLDATLNGALLYPTHA